MEALHILWWVYLGIEFIGGMVRASAAAPATKHLTTPSGIEQPAEADDDYTWGWEIPFRLDPY